MYDKLLTRHCSNRMSQRQISTEEITYAIEHGVFKEEPQRKSFKVSYGSLIVVLSHDEKILTAYRRDFPRRESLFRRKADAKHKVLRHKQEVLKIAEFNQEIKFA